MGPKPSEVVLAALAACQEMTWRLYADALGIPLSSIAVEHSMASKTCAASLPSMQARARDFSELAARFLK
jgi:uncharacterized OsmC-like protein